MAADDIARDLSVEMVFELGRLVVPVTELETRQPGFTFELNLPVDSLLPIRVNGQLVARGQLVEVGGRLAVTLREVLPDVV